MLNTGKRVDMAALRIVGAGVVGVAVSVLRMASTALRHGAGASYRTK